MKPTLQQGPGLWTLTLKYDGEVDMSFADTVDALLLRVVQGPESLKFSWAVGTKGGVLLSLVSDEQWDEEVKKFKEQLNSEIIAQQSVTGLFFKASNFDAQELANHQRHLAITWDALCLILQPIF